MSNDCQKYIPYGRQYIDEDDIDAVVKVLHSDFLTQGPVINQFEDAIKHLVGAKYAVAFQNATAALHGACKALGLEEGDYLWTTPNTFVASANCGLYCGAQVDFVDINSRTLNIDVDILSEKLERASIQGVLPKIIVAVHFAGEPCEMFRLHQICRQYGIKIIEDASHAVGARYKDTPVGQSKYSDITVFSFHPVKIITTGEGGIAVTNNDKLAAQMQLFRSHGITRDLALMKEPPEGPWYYEQIQLGYNYRITDIQAALGLSQLQKLQSFLDSRHRIAATYDGRLKDLPLTLPYRDLENYSAIHLYAVQIDFNRTKQTRLAVFNYLRDRKIGVNVHYIPVYWQPYYQELGFRKGYCPSAETYYKSAITIPLYPTMADQEVDFVCRSLEEISW